MVQKERLEILDDQDFDLFALTHGPSLGADFASWIQLITIAGPTEQSFRRLNTLALFIFLEQDGPSFGEPSRFVVTSEASSFRKLLYDINMFSAMQVPFNEWRSLVLLLLSTLKKMIDSNNLDFDSADCQGCVQHAADILAQFRTKAKFNAKFADFLNGSF